MEIDEKGIVVASADYEAVRNHGAVQIGDHRIQFESADIVRAEFTGNMSMAQLIYLHRLFEERLRRGERIFLLAILPQGGDLVPPEARRWLADWNRRHQAHGLAIVSPVSWLSATITELMMRAIGLIRGKPLPFSFFKTEADARQWIASLHRK